MIELPRSAHYDVNIERHGKADDHCVVCGKPVRSGNLQVHLWWGSHIVTEEEAAGLDASGDTGFYPIGRDCVRRYLTPEQARQYVHKAKEQRP